MEPIIQTLLLAAILVVTLVALVKVNAVQRMLRTPEVKKLNPDFNKQGRRVNMQDVRSGQNRDNRPQQNPQRPAQPGPGPRPQGGAPEQNRGEGRGDNRGENRGENRDGRRDGRDGRGDRNRDGRRDGRDNRDGRRDGRGDRNRDGRERRPEIMGNEVEQQVAVAAEAQSSNESVGRPSFEGRPPVEGRRPLEPRFTEPAVSESSSHVSTEASSAPAASEGAMDFDPSRIRHGRRPMVRKNPAVEAAEPAAPTTPSVG